MAEQTYLKVTLKLMALYAGLMSVLTMLFQDAGSLVFQYQIQDSMLARYWGGVLMAMAVFYLFLSTDPDRYRLFIWVGVFDLGIAMLLTIVHIAVATISWVQGLVGVVINPILLIVLLYGLAKKPEGEVIMVAGQAKGAKQGEELPPHLSGEHPLQNK